MLRTVLLISVLIVGFLPAASTSAEDIINPLVRYSSDFDGRRHSLGITADSTRITIHGEIFRVSARLVLNYFCHETGIGHPGIPLRVHAWHHRLHVEPPAAISMESAANFTADFLDLEPPPFVISNGAVRVTDLGTDGFVETPAAISRAGSAFTRDTVYKILFDPAVASPERLLRTFNAGNSVKIEVTSTDYSVSAVFSLNADEAALLTTIGSRCPASVE